MLDWIGGTWDRFESWVVEIWPGLHTKLIAFAGVLYSFAIVLQEYVQGLNLESFITPTSLAIVNIVLFSLIFWLRNVNNRVIARELKVTSKKIKSRAPFKAESLEQAGELIRNDKLLGATQAADIGVIVAASELAKKEAEIK